MVFRRYSDRFTEEEDAALTDSIGLWQTDFEPPWEYRAKRWQVAAQKAPAGCPIKGNINREGERSITRPGDHSGTTGLGSAPPKESAGSATNARPSTPAGARRCDSEASALLAVR